jgi:hypothetical protein
MIEEMFLIQAHRFDKRLEQADASRVDYVQRHLW